MTIEWFRDLVIIVYGLGGLVVFIFLAVLGFLTYRRLSPVLDSVKKTAKTVENLSATVGQLAGPLAKVVAFIQGIRQALGLVRNFRDKEED